MRTYIITYVHLDTGQVATEEIQRTILPNATLALYQKHKCRILIMSVHDLDECIFTLHFHKIPLPPEVLNYLEGMTDGLERAATKLNDITDAERDTSFDSPSLDEGNGDVEEDHSEDWKKLL